MRFYVEAYEADGRQRLGNLDGQRSWEGRDYRRAKWFAALPALAVSHRIAYWRIVDARGRVLEVVQRAT